jgi:hypothetical protein
MKGCVKENIVKNVPKTNGVAFFHVVPLLSHSPIATLSFLLLPSAGVAHVT